MFAIVLLSSRSPSMRRALTLLGCVTRHVLRAACENETQANKRDFAYFSLLLLGRRSLLRSLQGVLRCGAGKSSTLPRWGLGLGDEHIAIAWAGNRAFDHEQIVFEGNSSTADVADSY